MCIYLLVKDLSEIVQTLEPAVKVKPSGVTNHLAVAPNSTRSQTRSSRQMSSYFAHPMAGAEFHHSGGSNYPQQSVGSYALTAEGPQHSSHRHQHYQAGNPVASPPASYAYPYTEDSLHSLQNGYYTMEGATGMDATTAINHHHAASVNSTCGYTVDPCYQTSPAAMGAISRRKTPTNTPPVTLSDCASNASPPTNINNNNNNHPGSIKGSGKGQTNEQIYPWMRRIHSTTGQ